jgi:diguanylate cyclase
MKAQARTLPQADQPAASEQPLTSTTQVHPLLAKASAAGLFVVLLMVSGFAIWSSQSSSRSTERAIASSRLSDDFNAAHDAVAAEESLERKYRLEPGPEVRARFGQASAQLIQALDKIRQHGTAADLAVADAVMKAHTPYLASMAKLFDAVDSGDQALVLAVDRDEVDPQFDAIEEVVNRAADERHAAALAELSRLNEQARFITGATPVVFFVGLVLVALFSSVLRRLRGQLEVQRKQAMHAAVHDILTGLPNRTLLADRFDQALRNDERNKTHTGLLLIDLDRFKEVNDTLGHHVGDQLLAQIGPRLAATLRGADTVARLGGDEFAVLLPAAAGVDEVVDVAHRVRSALMAPFYVQGIELDVDASIGVVLSGLHGTQAATLLQRADVAMYVAKTQTRGVMVYDASDDEHSPERLSLLGQLRRAIEGDELFLVYQPKLKLSTGQCIGVEALVRWQHPLRGVVPPNDFIPMAEHTGLIGPLTLCVLNQALLQTKAWFAAGPVMPVSVNISARNLHDDDFANKLADLLQQHAVPAHLLELELTESAVMLEPDRAKRILHQLHGLGIRIAIDDFGAGYTSLAQLRDLPISDLKIDKSFVLSMHNNHDDAHIVRSMIELGHSLNMQVVAEGVETADTASLLTGYGCDMAQGYHLCRPVSPQALMSWFEARVVLPGDAVKAHPPEPSTASSRLAPQRPQHLHHV